MRLIFCLFAIFCFYSKIAFSNNEKKADSLFKYSNYNEAINYYNIALSKKSNYNDSLDIILKTAYANYYLNNYYKVEEILNKIDFKNLGKNMPRYYYLKSCIFNQNNNNIKAESYLNKAICYCYKNNSNDTILADCLIGKSIIFNSKSDFNSGKLYSLLALKYYIKNRASSYNYINIMITLYSSYYNTGDTKKSEKIINILYKIDKHIIVSKTNKIRIYRTIGIHWVYKENFALALEYLTKANELLNSTTKSDDIIEINRFLGYVYYRLCDYSSSYKYYNSLSNILISENKSPASICESQFYIITSKIALKDSSVFNNIELLISYNKISKRYSEGEVLERIGRAYQDYDTLISKQYYYKALDAFEKENSNNPILNNIYTNLALFESKHNPNKSIKFLQKVKTIITNKSPKNSNDFIKFYNNSATVARNQNDLKSSLNFSQQAMILNCINFNPISQDENPQIKNIFDVTSLINSLLNKGEIYTLIYNKSTNVSDLKYSLEAYKNAIKACEDLLDNHNNEESKLFVQKNYNKIYSPAIIISHELFLKTRDYEYLHSAFYISEKNKVLVLNKNINNKQIVENCNLPEELKKSETKLNNQISFLLNKIHEYQNKEENVEIYKLKNLLFEKEKDKQFLIDKIKKYCPDYNSEISLNITELKKRLKDKVLIEYSISDSLLFSFVISEDTFVVNKTKTDKNFISTINSFYNFIVNTNFNENISSKLDSFYYSSNELYKILIKPFESIIKNKSLIIIPDKNLSFIPFESLIYEITVSKHPNYLIFKNPISYSYSAYTLMNDFNTNSEKNFAGFFPTYNYNKINNYPKLPPLSRSISDANKLSSEFLCDTFTNLNASERNFRQIFKKYDIVHLSMHSILDEKNPEFTKLCFTKNNDSIFDELFNINELSTIESNASHVVLSSCNTGTGKFETGEGVMSFSRAFLEAGCPSIIMSLWPADEFSSSEITYNYYKYLNQGFSKDIALQKSKIDFINNSDFYYQHPYFWSGISLIGDTQPVKFKINIMSYLKWSILSLSLAFIIIIIRVITNRDCKIRLWILRNLK